MNTVRINGQDYTSSLSDAEIAFMGNLSLPTTAQTLSGAIAEHENDISELNSNLTNLKTIKTHTWTTATNNNGVTAIPQNICKPSEQILLAVYCGSGSYGYYRTDTISSDVYGICVIDLTKTTYTKVTNTTLTFTIAYIDAN